MISDPGNPEVHTSFKTHRQLWARVSFQIMHEEWQICEQGTRGKFADLCLSCEVDEI